MVVNRETSHQAELLFAELARRLQLTDRQTLAILEGRGDRGGPPRCSRFVRIRQFTDMAQSVCLLTGNWHEAARWLTAEQPALLHKPVDAIAEDPGALQILRAILLREAYEVSAVRNFFR